MSAEQYVAFIRKATETSCGDKDQEILPLWTHQAGGVFIVSP